MDKHVYVGVDVGGTTVKLAFIQGTGEILNKWEIPTDLSNKGNNILKQIADTIAEKMNEYGVPSDSLKAVGVGAPGFIDVTNGSIIEAVNIGWRDFPLKEVLEKETNLPVFIDNDANLAAAGEMWKGAGEGAKNLLAVTLGTGVGGGILAGGEIIHGESGMAGEIGHITSVASGGAPCNCGKTGCLETVASATGIARLGIEAIKEKRYGLLQDTFEKKETLTAKDILDAAKKEDPLANQVVKQAMSYLGFALANLANALNPQTIVIGGGVSKAGIFLVDLLETEFKKYTIPKIGEDTKIRIATLGNDAGVIGAAWLAKQNTNG
ncbi:ROK family glucokinase [Bacillus shivajii]|uniref:ROK family glucokinase n=1 Tax=Bacillus shivajii TaxID=1983719 RepID=UPI001CFA5093|nr:ROK family glucokinase [Bacillus shivajii]UCZ54561.1 ROK family glucokinase [Bacillus shivajii]